MRSEMRWGTEGSKVSNESGDESLGCLCYLLFIPEFLFAPVLSLKVTSMFDSEIVINEFQLNLFTRIVADLPESQLFQPAAGHGHPPVWVLGHLAVCAELGQKLLGGKLSHPRWMVLFGPGSSDRVADDGTLTRAAFVDANIEGYAKFRDLAALADPQRMLEPHGVELLNGTAIQTVGHLITHLLTSHLAFHMSQLSSSRRAGGHKALF